MFRPPGLIRSTVSAASTLRYCRGPAHAVIDYTYGGPPGGGEGVMENNLMCVSHIGGVGEELTTGDVLTDCLVGEKFVLKF